MSDSTSTSRLPSQSFIGEFYSRRLLLHNQLYNSPTEADSPAPGNSHHSYETFPGHKTFDANVVMVLSVFLCALICSLALNSIIRCALRCSSLASSQSAGNSSAPVASRGIKRKAVRTFPTVTYSTHKNPPGLAAECAICLSEFTPGERVRLLPKCNHGFHVRCIDKWLTLHSSCPTCRHCLINTCNKIVGCDQASSSLQNSTVNIAPLEPEGFMRTHRGII